MYLFLKLNEVDRVISNISLDNDCAPVVEGVTVAPRSTSGRQSILVDTIPWFKSLAIDAVYIDCGLRVCRWVPKMFTEQAEKNSDKAASAGLDKSQSNGFFPISARPLFLHGGDMANFDPLADELYERAESILQKGMTEEEVRTESAQLLHCCVFPAVEFSKTDIPVLQGCSQRIALRIQSLEDDIREKEAELTVTEDILSKRKSKILDSENLCDLAKVRSFAPDFVNAFYDCLAKDIKDTYAQMELKQQKVKDERKRNVDVSGKKLEDLVRERDATHERLQQLLTVRETLREVLDAPPSASSPTKKTRKKSKEQKTAHVAFVQTHGELKAAQAKANRLCYQRLYCAAVKKAIDASVRQVDRGREVSACDFSEFSLSVGLEGAGDRSGWKSMQDRVKDVMEQHGSVVHREHLARCQLVLDLVSSLLSEQAILAPDGPSSSDKILDDRVDDSRCQMTQERQDERAERDDFCDSVSSATFSSTRRKALKALLDHVVETVCDQMLGAAKVIVLHLGLDAENARHVRRAWLCYEPHFCHVTLGRLEQAYSNVHADLAARLYDRIISFTVSDIVDEGFFKDFFVHNLQRDDDSGRTLSGVTGLGSTEAGEAQGQGLTPALSVESIVALSLDFRRCSVRELYELADKDCRKLCYQMQDLLQTDMSSTSSSHRSDSSSTSDPGAKPEGKELDSGGGHPDSDNSSEDTDSSTEVKVMTQLKKRVSALEFMTSQARLRPSVASLVDAFESVTKPFNALMQDVVASPDLLGKLSLLYQAVTFLSQQVALNCKGQGMDNLLPMSILATVSLQKDIFVRLFVQLKLLHDISHHVVLPSVYDFCLTTTYMPYFFLSERKTFVESTA